MKVVAESAEDKSRIKMLLSVASFDEKMMVLIVTTFAMLPTTESIIKIIPNIYQQNPLT